jgi:hypothetical protein
MLLSTLCLDQIHIISLFIFIFNLGSALVRIANDDEMTKRNKGLHLKTLLFLDIYRIQILQNIAH